MTRSHPSSVSWGGLGPIVDSRVVDEYVDPSVLAPRRLDEPLGRLGKGDVTLCDNALLAACLDLRPDVLQTSQVHAVDDQVRPLAGKRQRNLAANSAGGSRHSNDFSLKHFFLHDAPSCRRCLMRHAFCARPLFPSATMREGPRRKRIV